MSEKAKDGTREDITFVPTKETEVEAEVASSICITRKNSGCCGGVPTNVFTSSPSSEQFGFNFRLTTEDDEIETTVSGIDQMSHLYVSLAKKPPTLEEALKSMRYEKAEELTELFTKNATGKLKELDAPGLTVEDVAVILCYTFEWTEDVKRTFGCGISPYKMLNNSLSVDRSSSSIKITRGFLFLLLRAMRKLPRFVPDNHTLYRGIKVHVQTEEDPEFPDRKPYALGSLKIWWGVVSATTNLEITQMFLGNVKSTLFVVSGNPWGYDISVFSGFPEEKEILLEPERKLCVLGTIRKDELITVNAEMVGSPLILEVIVNPSKTIKMVKAKKSSVKEVPMKLKAENVTQSSAVISWAPVNAKGKDVTYQVVVKKAGWIFNRNSFAGYEGTDTKCVVDNLEQWTEYEFQVRCGYNGEFGKWTEKISVKTQFPAPGHLVAQVKTWDTVSLFWVPVSVKGATYQLSRLESTYAELNPLIEYTGKDTKFTVIKLTPNSENSFWVRAGVEKTWSAWYGPVVAKTLEAPDFTEHCTWRECPESVDPIRKYTLGVNNPRIATKVGAYGDSVILGNVPIPLGKVVSWKIKMLNLQNTNGRGAKIGVALFGMTQNSDAIHVSYGWYLDSCSSTLCSGHPHYYFANHYGPRKKDLREGRYVNTGDSVGVVMDTVKGEISFVVDGVNHGAAYEGVPLDLPLTPCVILQIKGDVVELITSSKEKEEKE